MTPTTFESWKTFFRLEPLRWAVVALTSSAVICVELLNTALEHLTDHLHPQEHQRIKLVKDSAAAAVLMAVVGALAVAAAMVVHVCTRAEVPQSN
jgi:diacylglycerol kinase